MKKCILLLLLSALVLGGCGREAEPVQEMTVPILTEIPTELLPEPETTQAPTAMETEVTENTEPAEETAEPAPDGPRGPAISAKVANTKSVNVRTGPSSKSKRVMKLNKGDKVLVYSTLNFDGKGWARIDDGWICMEYLDLQEDLSALGPVPGMPGVVIGAATVNVRAEPSAKSEKVDTLSQYDVVYVTETTEVNGTAWGQIQQGWVSLKYLALDKTPQDTDVMKSDTAATPTEDLS